MVHRQPGPEHGVTMTNANFPTTCPQLDPDPTFAVLPSRLRLCLELSAAAAKEQSKKNLQLKPQREAQSSKTGHRKNSHDDLESLHGVFRPCTRYSCRRLGARDGSGFSRCSACAVEGLLDAYDPVRAGRPHHSACLAPADSIRLRSECGEGKHRCKESTRNFKNGGLAAASARKDD